MPVQITTTLQQRMEIKQWIEGHALQGTYVRAVAIQASIAHSEFQVEYPVKQTKVIGAFVSTTSSQQTVTR